MSDKGKPVTIIFGTEAVGKIETLRTKRGASTTSQVIRDALTVLSTLEDLKESDGTITIQKDGQLIKYQF